MLNDQDLQEYASSLTADQKEAVIHIRELIVKYNPDLQESIDNGKWYKGLIVYKTPDGFFVYALGPRAGGQTTFHMMPFYGSTELQAQYGSALKKYLSGKSCIQFKRYDDLPHDALEDIIKRGPEMLKKSLEQLKKR